MNLLNHIYKIGAILAITLGIAFFTDSQTQAATAGHTLLTANVTYSNYDINADGKTDTILVTSSRKSEDENDTMQIIVNGASVYEDTVYVGTPCVELITLSNGQSLLYIDHEGIDGDRTSGTYGIYRYGNGKLKKLATFEDVGKNGVYGLHLEAKIKKVSGKKLTIRFSEATAMLGGIRFDVTYQYVSGKLKADQKAVPLKVMTGYTERGYAYGNTLTAAREMTIYEKRGSAKNAIYNIQPNEKVKIKKIWQKNGKVWIQVEAGGKTGWQKMLKEKDIPYNAPFYSDIILYG